MFTRDCSSLGGRLVINTDLFIFPKDEEIERGDGRSSQRAGRKQSLPREVTNKSVFVNWTQICRFTLEIFSLV